ncbi:hypothetical protein ACFWMJ_04025 [Streptomyces hawaiiensis]|uniref:hypothetical protein n=1 Tax=Streptomyces hawaiiensis TaxID=67305 RepID=UPI00364E1982
MNGLRWAVALSGWAALAASRLPETSPVRQAAVAVFLLVCPGLAATLLWAGELFAPRAGGARLLEGAVLTGAVGLSLTALVAEALFLSNAFTLTRALLILAILCSALALASVLRGGGRHPRRVTAGKS